ncbi:MAG TPA: UvrD-helicase domain-containing protein [Thermotogota bacterium]|nr:UvrD-helicase domain-containing protein [Thermotogota bacterium]HPJ87687.1 UvrD-helicase domain-containing protein [Thermotogota bacterium]HPR94874.1 UvrD-helicase domain-containing protein [Thermotogota bacterium]
MIHIRNNLNEQQSKIINSTGDIFVKAGAGTGKTRTIVELYFSLLNEKHYDVKNILAITFTDKAAKEMKERIMKKIEEARKTENTADSVYFNRVRNRLNFSWISTMHGFCVRVLREFPLEAGVDPMFEVIDEGEKRKRIKYCIRNYFNQQEGNRRFERLKDLAMIYRYDKLLYLFEEALLKKQYDLLNYSGNFDMKTADRITGERLHDSLPFFHEAFTEILEMYNSENKRENKYDYDQLLFETSRVFNSSEKVREKLEHRFKCIIVDEFQDTNEQQKQIINHLRGTDKIVFVGDAKQSIYLFNGADVSVFNKTQEEFDECEKYELFQNYRSNKRLIEFFNLFFSKVFAKDEAKPFTVNYDQLSGENDLIIEQPVKLLPMTENFSQECEQIARYIICQNTSGKPFREFAVLLRRMTNVELLEKAFRKFHIPYFITGSRGFFKTPEIVAVRAFLKAVYNPHDDENMILLLRSYLSPFSDSELIEMRLLNKKSLFNALEEFSDQEPSRRYFYEALVDFRMKMNLISPPKLIKEIIEVFHYEFLLSQLDHARKRLLNLKKFVEFSESFEGSLSLRNFLQKIDNAQTSSESEASVDTERSDVVRVMTIHKSKGLEFPVVIVPELGYVKSAFSNPYIVTDYETGKMSLRDPEDSSDSGSQYMKMLSYDKEKEFEEEKRVLYVAFTRAVNELVLSYSEPKTKKKQAVYRKSLIEGEIIIEDGKEVFWNNDQGSKICRFLRNIPRSSLEEADGKVRLSETIKTIPLDEKLIIPETVYNLENKPWRKYLSPTLLCETDYNNLERRIKEIVTVYDGDELKDYSEEGDSESRKNLGIAVHKVLEELGELKMRDFNDGTIDQILKDDANSRELLPSIKVIFRKLRESRNKELFELENASEVLSEIPVRKKLGNYILTGTIDKLYKTNMEWKVMDFKFASYSEKSWENYIFQMQFYLYCLKGLCHPEPETGYIFFLKNNKVMKVKRDDQFKTRLIDKIERFNQMSKL